MKRIFEFLANEKEYILMNNNPNSEKEVFVIKKEDMKFDTKRFYEYVFSDLKENTEVEFINKADENDKAARRVYGIMSEIKNGALEKIKEIKSEVE